ncbi:MAG: hypothetical protein COZ67_01620 [Chloroflexi bacterium CG_4_8_14_3_um_filter_45_15]|nr:MAG: hypothetical protein COZ67_01620 [Chloroflexi bacterium CG_4_8_14_3_um_filter_45_15]
MDISCREIYAMNKEEARKQVVSIVNRRIPYNSPSRPLPNKAGYGEGHPSPYSFLPAGGS